MSITFQRNQIEQKINSMDPGLFQEFMLKFLPLYDEKYEGMIRNGGTSEGKPRKGIPDLIKIYEKGEQIGCECGTEADYWKFKKDITTLKPIKDAEKCLKNLQYLVEIILASSREFPPTKANTKSEIIKYLSKINTHCKFTLFSSACLAEWLINNLRREDVFKLAENFFPEAVENAILMKNKEIYKLGSEAFNDLGYPDLNRLLETFTNTEYSKAEIKSHIMTMTLGDNSRFIYSLPHSFKGIKRIEKSCPKLCSPLGKISLLSGIPKIGKHYLVWEMIDSKQLNYKWFMTPVEDNLLNDFVKNLLISIYSFFMEEEQAIAKVINNKPTNNESTKIDVANPYVIIVGNAQYLSDNNLRTISQHLSEIRKDFDFSKIGIIFISNKNINYILFEEKVTCKKWDKAEIKKLVNMHGVEIVDSESEGYFDCLELFSKGHPVLALFLAKKYSYKDHLYINCVTNTNSSEENLENEIKVLLYKHMLTTNDQVNFMQRLSLLTEKANEEILDCIRSEVEPPINTTVPLIIDQVGKIILEGSLEEGLVVSPICKNLLMNMVGKKEKIQVYEKVAKKLMLLKENVIDLERFLAGIFYLSLSGNIRDAARNAIFLLCQVGNMEKDKELLQNHCLNQLYYFEYPLVKEANEDYFSLSVLRAMMGILYLQQFQNTKKAANLFNLIDVDKINEIPNATEEIRESKEFIKNALIGSKFFTLKEQANPNEVVMEYLNFFSNNENTDSAYHYIKIVPDTISLLPNDMYLTLNFSIIAKYLYPDYIQQISRIAVHMGYLAWKDNVLIGTLNSIDVSTSPGAYLMKNIAMFSFCSHGKKLTESKLLAEEIETYLLSHRLNLDLLGSEFYQRCAEDLKDAGDRDKALTLYKRSNALSSNNCDYFDLPIIAWNNLMMGSLSINEEEFLSPLKEAHEIFSKLNSYDYSARALGVLGCQYLILGEYEKAIEIGIKLNDLYYKENIYESCTALRFLMLHMISATKIARGEVPSSSNDNFLKLDVFFYINSGDQEVSGGEGSMFYIMAGLCNSVNMLTLRRELLKKSMFSNILTEVDIQVFRTAWAGFIDSFSHEEINEDLLYEVLPVICKYQPEPNYPEENSYFESIFFPFKVRIKQDRVAWEPALHITVRIAEVVANKKDNNLGNRWKTFFLKNFPYSSKIM